MVGGAKFWGGFKVVVLVLLVVTLVGAVFAFVLLPGNKGTFFGVGGLFLALNLLLMYFFIRVNDKRRPRRWEDRDLKRN